MLRVFLKQLGWSGLFGLFFGGFGLVMFFAASFFWLMNGDYFPGFLTLVVGIFCCTLVWLAILAPAILFARLAIYGEPAVAKILRVTESGITLRSSRSPRNSVTLYVEVQPQNGKSAYPATMKLFVSMFDAQAIQPGNLIDVMVDKRNPKRVGISQT
jgi:hypothetical protein